MSLRLQLTRNNIKTVISVGHSILFIYYKALWEKEGAVKYCHIFQCLV